MNKQISLPLFATEYLLLSTCFCFQSPMSVKLILPIYGLLVIIFYSTTFF